jgi:hypothetical protein
MQDKFLKIGWIWMVLVGIQRIFGGIMLVAMEAKDLVGLGFFIPAIAIPAKTILGKKST